MSILDRFRLDGRTAILTGVGPGVGVFGEAAACVPLPQPLPPQAARTSDVTSALALRRKIRRSIWLSDQRKVAR